MLAVARDFFQRLRLGTPLRGVFETIYRFGSEGSLGVTLAQLKKRSQKSTHKPVSAAFFHPTTSPRAGSCGPTKQARGILRFVASAEFPCPQIPMSPPDFDAVFLMTTWHFTTSSPAGLDKGIGGQWNRGRPPRAMFGCHGPCGGATDLVAAKTGQVCTVACPGKSFLTAVCTRTGLVFSGATPVATGTRVFWSGRRWETVFQARFGKNQRPGSCRGPCGLRHPPSGNRKTCRCQPNMVCVSQTWPVADDPDLVADDPDLNANERSGTTRQ